MFKRSFIGYNPKSVDEHKQIFELQMNEQLEQIDNAVNSAISEQNELSEELQTVTARIDASLLGTVLISKYQDDLAVVLNEFRAAADERMASNQRETEEFTREIDQQIEKIEEQIFIIKAKIRSLGQGITAALDRPDNNLMEMEEQTAQIEENVNQFTLRVEESGVSMVGLKTKGNTNDYQAVADASQNGLFTDQSSMNWKSVRQAIDDDEDAKSGGTDDFLAKLRRAWQS